MASTIADPADSANKKIVKEAGIKADRVGSDKYKQNHMGLIFQEGLSFSGFERNKFFVGDGKGTFEDLSDVSGADSEMDCRAACLSDFDHDGDMDLFVNSIQRRTHLLYRNNLAPDVGFVVKLRLRATTLHPDAIGATIRLVGDKVQTRVLSCGSGFESQHTREVNFGVANADAKTIKIQWPGGKVETFTVQPSKRGGAGPTSYLIVEGSGKPLPIKPRAFALSGKSTKKFGLAVGLFMPEMRLGKDNGLTESFVAENPLPTVINFWSTSCVPCLHELPDLAKVAASGKYRVQLCDMDPPSNRERVNKMLKKLAPELANGQPTAESLERLFGRTETTLPTSIIIDPSGRIQRIVRGVISLKDFGLDENSK